MQEEAKNINCADCFHYEACHRMGREIPAESCSTFKDKRQIIELPCQIGGSIWLIVTKRTKPPVHEYSYVRQSQLTWVNLQTMLCNFGKTVFLTRQEAQQALRECNPEPKRERSERASAPVPNCEYYPTDGARSGCELLTERLCETRGHCSFCKPCE